MINPHTQTVTKKVKHIYSFFNCQVLLKRRTLSNKTYLEFENDYLDMYGENSGKSFREMIAWFTYGA